MLHNQDWEADSLPISTFFLNSQFDKQYWYMDNLTTKFRNKKQIWNFGNRVVSLWFHRNTLCSLDIMHFPETKKKQCLDLLLVSFKVDWNWQFKSELNSTLIFTLSLGTPYKLRFCNEASVKEFSSQISEICRPLSFTRSWL